ncbi:MAG: radical SAM protein [Nitrospirota bacterium]|nr:radical SAM protein [Nitrospirota bacterium]
MKQEENWHSDSMEFPAPEYIQLYPTSRCNQRCSFCFNPESSRPADMAFEDALILLDILADNGIRAIDIMGGEPFLVPWITDFAESALSKGMSLNISTNGSRPALLQKLRGIPRDFFNIGISLEGSTAEKHNRMTGSHNFASAIESIAGLIDLSLDPLVKTVLSRATASDIQDIVNLLRGIGVKRYYILHMDILSKKESETKNTFPYIAFLDFYRKIKEENPDIEIHRVNASCFDRNSLPPGVRCAGGVRKLSVLPDGAVFPCNLFHAFKGFELGNIFKDPFTGIWRHPLLALFRTYQKNGCGIDSCKNRPECTGGCPAHG